MLHLLWGSGGQIPGFVCQSDGGVASLHQRDHGVDLEPWPWPFSYRLTFPIGWVFCSGSGGFGKVQVKVPAKG